MFAAQETVGIFPSLVYRAQALPAEPAALQAVIAATQPLVPAQVPQGPRRRSPPALQAEPAFQELTAAIAAMAAEALLLAAFRQPDCVVSALWGEAAPCDWAEPVTQAPNAHLTFVLPLAVPPGFGVQVKDPRPQAQVIVPMVSEPNELNARQVTIPLSPGQILLLPGWMLHAVQGGGGQGGGGQGDMLYLRGQTLFRKMAEEVSPPMWTGMTANRS